MSHPPSTWLLTACALVATGTLVASEAAPAEPRPGYPDARDYGLMWWPDGWQSVDWSATDRTKRPLVRCVQTGHYAMAMDTCGLAIPHLGPIHAASPYAQAASAGDETVFAMSSADLKLSITTNGKHYRGVRGANPRLIDAGRFVQRGDIVGLLFLAEDGARLATNARLEVTAWPETLSFELEAGPAPSQLPAGPVPGHTGGGFSFDGGNELELGMPAEPDELTVAFWVYLPKGAAAENQAVYALCKTWHSLINSYYGFVFTGADVEAGMNIGGKLHTARTTHGLPEEQWTHVAMTFDGRNLKLFVDGKPVSAVAVNAARTKGSINEGGLVLGTRADKWGRKFTGVLDDVTLFDKPLSAEQLAALAKGEVQDLPAPLLMKTFDDVAAKPSDPGTTDWADAALEMELSYAGQTFTKTWRAPAGTVLTIGDRQRVGLSIHPARPEAAVVEPAGMTITAHDPVANGPVGVRWVAENACYEIDMNRPAVPHDGRKDYFDTAVLRIENPTDQPAVVPLWFRQAPCKDAIGVAPVLRELDGTPTGIPVQISKDWHTNPDGAPYDKTWIHAYTLLRVPPRSTRDYRLDFAHSYWGTLPAASHAQLSLVGWDRRADQQWDQVAIGSWGEMICYDPDVCLFRAFINDVRPLFVAGTAGAHWDWTNNVGGGDIPRLRRMKTAFVKNCPVATEVIYSGTTKGITGRFTASTVRADDFPRHFHTVRYDVHEAVSDPAWCFYSVGARSYNDNAYDKAARGNAAGMIEEWVIPEGAYDRGGIAAEGAGAWFSLHGVRPAAGKPPSVGGAQRGLIVRGWKARLGGKDAPIAHFALCGASPRPILELTAPPGVKELVPGDFLEATVELVVLPAVASDYYGPDASFKALLADGANTWQPVLAEARVGSGLEVKCAVGEVERLFPLTMKAQDNRAEFSLAGSLGYAPITFTGLSGYHAPVLEIRAADGTWQAVDQAKEGNDFWQTDYDVESGTWSITYTVPPAALPAAQPRHELRFRVAVGSGRISGS